MTRSELVSLLARLNADAAELRGEARRCADVARHRDYWNRKARALERRAAQVSRWIEQRSACEAQPHAA